MKKIIYYFSISLFCLLSIILFKIGIDGELANLTQLPVVEISVEDGVWPIDKVNLLNGEFSIVFPNDFGNVRKQDIIIRARGNGTLAHPKKSYKIKFDDKIDLVGEKNAPARDWLLIANYADLTMMRNHYTYESMKKLDHISFAPDSMFVEVIFNDQYQGVYLLCEPVEVDENRIDIDDELTSVENGFLIERDLYPTGEKGIDYFGEGKALYAIKSNVYNEDQVKYAENIILKVEEAIYSGDPSRIKDAMDVPSSIDTYLLYEFTKNIDVGFGSFYMHIYPENERLFFGTPWDFDLALGNDLRLDNGSHEGLYVGNEVLLMYQSHEWFQVIMQQEWYQKEVIVRWNEIKHIFLETSGEILDTSNKHREAFNRDQDFWQNMVISNEPDVQLNHLTTFSTHDEHILYLVEWIDNRYIWLDHYFNHIMVQ